MTQKGNLYAFDGRCPLAVQLICVPGMRFPPAVFETAAGVGLEHTVFLAEVAVAEVAVADDALGGFLAVLEVAARLARRHFGRSVRGGVGWRRARAR